MDRHTSVRSMSNKIADTDNNLYKQVCIRRSDSLDISGTGLNPATGRYNEYECIRVTGGTFI